MKIRIAEHYGLCFGVRDAIHLAEQTSNAKPLTILGELAHNPSVISRLRRRGIREASLDQTATSKTKTVMITAHGASDKARQAWANAGFDVMDSTCPLVRQAHEQLKELVSAGYFPVVIGQPGHVEVRGLTGDFPHAVVITDASDIETLPHPPKLGVIAQTTQPIDRVRALVNAIQTARPGTEVRFCDTVCRPTKDRQKALQSLFEEVEAVVVVGGRNSNNTRKLVERSKAAGKITFHVEGPDDLREAWFDRIETVGITAGTSTLQESVQAVYKRLDEIATHKHQRELVWD